MINLKTKDFEIQNIETVLFDKDGTLIDLHYFWGKMTELRALEVIKNYNLKNDDFKKKLCLFLGYDIKTQKMLPDGITALYSRSKIIEIFKNDLKEIGIIATTKELEEIFDNVAENFYKNILEYTKPIPEAIEFIEKLYKKGVKMGIVTSDSIISTNLTIKQFGWEKYFDVAIGRESHPETKESGKPTLLALEKLNANPKTTLMIGDAPMDYISAKNAGVENMILVASGQIKKEKLKETCKFCTNSLNEIKIIVLR